MPGKDASQFKIFLDSYATLGRSALLPALHAAQSHFGYISQPVAVEIAQALRVPLADVHGVIEFYSLYYNQPVGERILRICTDPACALKGSEQTLDTFCHHAEQVDGSSWTVERTTCLGLCNRAPAANYQDSSSQSDEHTPHFGSDSLSFTLPTQDPTDLHQFLDVATLPFQPDYVAGQPRLLTALCGGERAANLGEYQASGGMQALQAWIGGRKDPNDLIAEIKASGLVGMGGAAFPTGVKWQSARQASGEPKYFIINADESEPGTFKDRILLEGDPCRVLEGAILGAYAVGAQKIFAFVRGEYPLAARRLQAAVQELEQAGFLGNNILGSDFSPQVEIRIGAGAYICGEETALFAAIEGERGFPRIKPPFPTTHGLFGKPTAINNVETLAKVPLILAHGAAVYRQIGTDKSPGTKLFCLSGDVAKPGLYEVPFGTPLRQLLELAGGVSGGELQAVLFGGAAGAFAGPESLDVRLSFEDLRSVGLPLGSGVVMVFNHTRDLRQALVQIARFFAHESCGKCYPCQLGTQRQYEVLERIAAGMTSPGDVERLEDIGWTMTDASLCGLGQTAAGVVLSAMRLRPELFRES